MFEEFYEFDKVFNQLLRQFFYTTKEFFGAFKQMWTPLTDIVETSSEFIIIMDLPGVDPKSIEIFITYGELLVQGIKDEEKIVEKAICHRLERSYGKFKRSIKIPIYIDIDGVTASFRNGVLKIKIPKTVEIVRRRKIDLDEACDLDEVIEIKLL